MNVRLPADIQGPTVAFLVVCWTLLGEGAAGSGVLRVKEREDQIIEIRAKVRHTTVLVLPKAENIWTSWLATPTTAPEWEQPTWPTSTDCHGCAHQRDVGMRQRSDLRLSGKRRRQFPSLGGSNRKNPGTDRRAAESPHKPAFVSRSMVEGYQHAARQATEAALAAKSDAEARLPFLA